MPFGDLLAVGDRHVRGLLGGSITYTPGVGSAVDVDGVFEAAYQRVDLGVEGVASVGPALFLTLADLPSDPTADSAATVTVDGVMYTPYEAHPDGAGGVLLMLHTSP